MIKPSTIAGSIGALLVLGVVGYSIVKYIFPIMHPIVIVFFSGIFLLVLAAILSDEGK